MYITYVCNTVYVPGSKCCMPPSPAACPSPSGGPPRNQKRRRKAVKEIRLCWCRCLRRSPPKQRERWGSRPSAIGMGNYPILFTLCLKGKVFFCCKSQVQEWWKLLLLLSLGGGSDSLRSRPNDFCLTFGGWDHTWCFYIEKEYKFTYAIVVLTYVS